MYVTVTAKPMSSEFVYDDLYELFDVERGAGRHKDMVEKVGIDNMEGVDKVGIDNEMYNQWIQDERKKSTQLQGETAS